MGINYKYTNAKRNSKYKNTKVTYNGIEFDSKKEASRYAELRLLQRAGKIQDLALQYKYELIPAQYEGEGKQRKCVERAVNYVADFRYIDTATGQVIVEDVKGYRDTSSAAYAKFVIKRKLMLYNYGIKIKEV